MVGKGAEKNVNRATIDVHMYQLKQNKQGREQGCGTGRHTPH